MTPAEIIGTIVSLIVAWSGSVWVAYRLIKGTVDDRIGDQNARITALETEVGDHKRDVDGRFNEAYRSRLERDSEHRDARGGLGRMIARLDQEFREWRQEQRQDKG